jgi:hypothetical protein
MDTIGSPVHRTLKSKFVNPPLIDGQSRNAGEASKMFALNSNAAQTERNVFARSLTIGMSFSGDPVFVVHLCCACRDGLVKGGRALFFSALSSSINVCTTGSHASRAGLYLVEYRDFRVLYNFLSGRCRQFHEHLAFF